MSDSGKQSPLGVNVLCSVLQNTGINLNQPTARLVGTSQTVPTYTLGTICNDTCLRLLTYSIRDAFVYKGSRVNDGTYNNLYTIGSTTVPALGNSKASTFTRPAWPNWCPYTTSNSYANELTSWGYVRLFALQAWNEFNINYTLPEYRDFLQSFTAAYSFVNYSNEAIMAMHNSKTFLEGVYSNMSDLTTADVAGINAAVTVFGQELVTLGKAIDLRYIDKFGLPAVLLSTLYQNNAMTPPVAQAVLTGMTITELNALLADVTQASDAQQVYLYEVFQSITGTDLADALIPLNCKTKNLESLADLLNIRKLFPASYISMTVPIYNSRMSASNSKLAYPIYTGTSIHSMLTIEQFGAYAQNILPDDIAIAAGAFSVAMRQVRSISTVPMEKFAQIVRNLETASGLPLTAGTTETREPLTNGQPGYPFNGQARITATKLRQPPLNSSTVPVNLPLVHNGLELVALGSGPHGTYTMSDMLGCMSGLPYDWASVKSWISRLETQRLTKIYKANYLAVTWDGATANVGYTTRQRLITPWSQGYDEQADPFIAAIPEVQGEYEHDWHVTGITIDNRGGGYGRGDTAPIPVPSLTGPAPAPLVVITGTSLATAECTINTNDESVPGLFGRVDNIFLTFDGNWVYYATAYTSAPNQPAGSGSGPTPPPPEHPVVTSPPLAQIQCPPTSLAAGVNTPFGTAGWSGMNSIVQTYIDQANTEITAIQASNPSSCASLNRIWDATGTQLNIEQRAITTGQIVPVPLKIAREDDLTSFPLTHYGFVDTIPQFATETKPHMAAQTLEAITDRNTVGGQSLIGMMRETRNQNRLAIGGIALDNNLDIAVPPGDNQLQNQLVFIGGTLPTSLGGTNVLDATFTGTGTTPIVDIDDGQADEPGSFAGSPYTDIVPPELDIRQTAGVLPTAAITPDEALADASCCCPDE